MTAETNTSSDRIGNNPPRRGWSSRVISGLFGIGGFTLAMLAMYSSCGILYTFESSEEMNLPPNLASSIFKDTQEAKIGLFNYQIIESTAETDQAVIGKCMPFCSTEPAPNSEVWDLAELLFILGLCAASIGIFFNFLELIYFNLPYSFLIPLTFLLFATALQGWSMLVLFLEPGGVCFQESSSVDCQLGLGAWYGLGAMASYLIAACLVCCTPRPTPCIGSVCCVSRISQQNLAAGESQRNLQAGKRDIENNESF